MFIKMLDEVVAKDFLKGYSKKDMAYDNVLVMHKFREILLLKFLYSKVSGNLKGWQYYLSIKDKIKQLFNME